jgi:hypothetical protein
MDSPPDNPSGTYQIESNFESKLLLTEDRQDLPSHRFAAPADQKSTFTFDIVIEGVTFDDPPLAWSKNLMEGQLALALASIQLSVNSDRKSLTISVTPPEDLANTEDLAFTFLMIGPDGPLSLDPTIVEKPPEGSQTYGQE